MIKKVKCTCGHEFQDSRYGKFMRIANWSSKLKLWRCTVCSKEHKE